MRINRTPVLGTLFGTLFVTIFAAGPLWADNQTDAIKIIDEMEAIYRGDSSRAAITMIVQTPQYQREMKMTSSAIGEEQSFIRILSPKKDRGIATLKIDNEMWNYFPKINKVIKVPPSMMMGSWMGSDFTNDDLVKQTTLTEEYDLSLVETDSQYRITLIPKAQTVTVWGKVEYVVDRVEMVPISQNFYDDRGELIRTLAFSEIKQFGNARLPSRLEMTPLNKAGHKTVIIYDDLEFNPASVDPSVFTLRNLKSRF